MPIDLHELASDAVSSLATLARERNVAAGVEGDAAEVVADPEYLRVVVIVVVVNLLENAIKYSGPGSTVTVTTAVGWSGRAARGERHRSGYPPDALPHIFDRFYRADSVWAHENGGSELGLAIACEIAEAHHGKLTAESEPGVGSRFVVRLPARGSA